MDEMELISKPVISCAGDEILVQEFQMHCLQHLANRHITWKLPKHNTSHSVRVEACFTQFRVDQLQSTVKVLSSGRPIRNVGTFQPLLYIFVISNNISHYNMKGGRNAVGSWLGHLRARNVFDWLIVMVNSDPQFSASKLWQKSSVLDKIKHDFNVRSCSRQFLQVPARNSVDDKVFLESWEQLTSLLRHSIVNACTSIIEDYDSHLQILSDSRENYSWDFFEYLDRKEELAHVYMFLGGHVHALTDYEDVIKLLSECIEESVKDESKQLPWLKTVCESTAAESCATYFLCNYPFNYEGVDTLPPARIRDRRASLFELRTYILSRQYTILCICDRLSEFPSRGYDFIVSIIRELHLLNLNVNPVITFSWILLVCLNILANMRLDVDKTKEFVNKTISQIIDTSHACCDVLPIVDFIADFRMSKYSGRLCQTNSTKMYQNVFYDCEKDQNTITAYMSHLIVNIYIKLMNPFNELLRTTSTSDINTSLNISKSSTIVVELWFIIFNYLKKLGQLVGRWCINSSNVHHRDNLALITKAVNSHTHILAPSSSSSSSNSDDIINKIDNDNNNNNNNNNISDNSNGGGITAHTPEHLITVLTSPMIYTQIFMSVGEILIGLLKFIHNPRRAHQIICDMADYCFTQEAYGLAAQFYEFVLSHFDDFSWLLITTSIRIKLAWCLRLLTIGKNEKFNKEFNAPRKYIQTCFILSGTAESVLHTAADNVYSKLIYCLQNSQITQTLSIPFLNDAYNPEFWWTEANDFLHSMSLDDKVVGNPFQMAPLFSVDCVELHGACDCGYQVVNLFLRSNTKSNYKVSICLDGVEPSTSDWRSVLKINVPHLLTNPLDLIHLTQLNKQDAKFSAVNLYSVDHRATSWENSLPSTESPTVSNAAFLRPERPSRKSNSKLIDKHRKDHFGSILNVAAAIATRPAWKSHDRLDDGIPQSQKMPLSRNDEQKLSRKRYSFTSTPVQNYANARKCSMFYYNETRNVIPTLPTHRSQFLMPPDESEIIIKPGCNRLQLVSTIPGFFLPTAIFIICHARLSVITDESPATSDNVVDKSQVAVKFTAHIEGSDLGVSWRNADCIHSLLPRPHLSNESGTQLKYPVVLGVSQPIHIKLKLGKLGLSSNTNLSTTIYQILPEDAPTYYPYNRNITNNYSLLSLEENKYRSFNETIKPKSKCFGPDVDMLVLADGPVDVKRQPAVAMQINKSCAFKHPPPDLQPYSLVKLVRPFYVTANYLDEQFVLAMPNGQFHQLPFTVIRPISFILNMFHAQKSHILFSLRVVSADVDQNLILSPCDYNKLNNRFTVIESTTFVLTNFQCYLHATPSLPNPSNIPPKFNVLKLEKRGETLSGALVDPQLTKVYVNRLTPATILWQFKVVDLENFIRITKDRGHLALVCFRCAINRTDGLEQNREIRVELKVL